MNPPRLARRGQTCASSISLCTCTARPAPGSLLPLGSVGAGWHQSPRLHAGLLQSPEILGVLSQRCCIFQLYLKNMNPREHQQQ